MKIDEARNDQRFADSRTEAPDNLRKFGAVSKPTILSPSRAMGSILIGGEVTRCYPACG
jgi:hypothetical protein